MAAGSQLWVSLLALVDISTSCLAEIFLKESVVKCLRSVGFQLLEPEHVILLKQKRLNPILTQHD